MMFKVDATRRSYLEMADDVTKTLVKTTKKSKKYTYNKITDTAWMKELDHWNASC